MGTGIQDRAAQLARCGLFGSVDSDFLERLAAEVSWIELPAGATLFEQGDEADSLYVIVRGRLRIISDDRTIAELGRDEPLGELGLLAAQPRNATARAVRDSELACLSHATFERLLRQEPAALAWLSRRVAERLSPTRFVHHRAPVARSVVVLGAADTLRDELVHRLADAMRNFGEVVVLRECPPALAEVVDRHEASGATTMLVPDAAWTEAAVGQADRVLVLADAGARPTVSRALEHMARLDPRGERAAEELVLLQPAGRRLPTGTADWLAVRPFAEHHHVGADLSSADIARLARHLAGRSIGLVLGGGGAKALAEIGAYRAICERGIPIDRVGGSSIGAVLAAQVAAGWSPEEMARVDTREFRKLRLDKRVTVPTISLLSVRAAAAMFERMFGEARLEDLWRPTFVTTVDLTQGTLAIHDRGRVSTWVRASASPPALWPAVADGEGNLHVDGAVLDNLPVAAMRGLGTDRVIAIDVSAPDEFRVSADSPEIASALTPFLQANKDSPRYPNLLKVLNRTAQVTSLGARELARASADVVIAPPLEGVGLTEYSAAARTIDTGYRSACEALDRAAADIAGWT